MANDFVVFCSSITVSTVTRAAVTLSSLSSSPMSRIFGNCSYSRICRKLCCVHQLRPMNSRAHAHHDSVLNERVTFQWTYFQTVKKHSRCQTPFVGLKTQLIQNTRQKNIKEMLNIFITNRRKMKVIFGAIKKCRCNL